MQQELPRLTIRTRDLQRQNADIKQRLADDALTTATITKSTPAAKPVVVDTPPRDIAHADIDKKLVNPTCIAFNQLSSFPLAKYSGDDTKRLTLRKWMNAASFWFNINCIPDKPTDDLLAFTMFSEGICV